MNFLFLLYRKLTDIFVRLYDWLRWLPKRIWRLLRHIWYGLLFFTPSAEHWKNTPSYYEKGLSFVHWSTESFFYLMDIFGIAELYETLLDFIKFNTRPLSKKELDIAQTIFGQSVHYRRVRIDNAAYAGPKQHRFAYVSFFTINSWGNMNPSFFIHELTHVWQYQQMGAVYIPRALWAQFSTEGYNYGGLPKLNAFLVANKKLEDFNLEQQADIVADYYRLQTGYQPQWGNGTTKDLSLYAHFVEPINRKEQPNGFLA